MGSGTARRSSTSIAMTSRSCHASIRALTPRRLHVEQPFVDGQVLAGAVCSEHVRAGAGELEIDKAGATHVVGVAFEEAIACPC